MQYLENNARTISAHIPQLVRPFAEHIAEKHGIEVPDRKKQWSEITGILTSDIDEQDKYASFPALIDIIVSQLQMHNILFQESMIMSSDKLVGRLIRQEGSILSGYAIIYRPSIDAENITFRELTFLPEGEPDEVREGCTLFHGTDAEEEFTSLRFFRSDNPRKLYRKEDGISHLNQVLSHIENTEGFDYSPNDTPSDIFANFAFFLSRSANMTVENRQQRFALHMLYYLFESGGVERLLNASGWESIHSREELQKKIEELAQKFLIRINRLGDEPATAAFQQTLGSEYETQDREVPSKIDALVQKYAPGVDRKTFYFLLSQLQAEKEGKVLEQQKFSPNEWELLQELRKQHSILGETLRALKWGREMTRVTSSGVFSTQTSHLAPVGHNSPVSSPEFATLPASSPKVLLLEMLSLLKLLKEGKDVDKLPLFSNLVHLHTTLGNTEISRDHPELIWAFEIAYAAGIIPVPSSKELLLQLQKGTKTSHEEHRKVSYSSVDPEKAVWIPGFKQRSENETMNYLKESPAAELRYFFPIQSEDVVVQGNKAHVPEKHWITDSANMYEYFWVIGCVLRAVRNPQSAQDHQLAQVWDMFLEDWQYVLQTIGMLFKLPQDYFNDIDFSTKNGAGNRTSEVTAFYGKRTPDSFTDAERRMSRVVGFSQEKELQTYMRDSVEHFLQRAEGILFQNNNAARRQVQVGTFKR